MKKIKRAVFKTCQRLYWGGGFSRGKSGRRSMTAGIGRSMILGGKKK